MSSVKVTRSTLQIALISRGVQLRATEVKKQRSSVLVVSISFYYSITGSYFPSGQQSVKDQTVVSVLVEILHLY